MSSIEMRKSKKSSVKSVVETVLEFVNTLQVIRFILWNDYARELFYIEL